MVQEAQQTKDQQSHILFLLLIYCFQVAARSTSPCMTTVFHARLYGRFTKIKSKLRRNKFYRTNQSSNFLGGCFSNRYVRAPIQFRRERQPKHLKRWFFLKNRPIRFYINSTCVIRSVKHNKLSFPSIKIKKPLPALVQSAL